MWFRRSCAVALLGAATAWSPSLLAHSAGQQGGGCLGCHGGGDYNIAVSTNPGNFGPGDNVTVTVTISSPGGNVAGMFVEASSGELSTLSGQGMAKVPAGLTHSAPKNMSGGAAQFSFGWSAPGGPGAVRFEVSTLVGNGNGSSSGDMADDGKFDFVFGCSGFTYYRDLDGDGYGRDDGPLLDCVGNPPAGYAAEGGDCNDSNPDVHPGAIEYCNLKDDNCNGVIDEDAIPLTLYPDADGDGYYSSEEGKSTDTIRGCVPTEGYAAEPGDCKPEDPQINPGAEEVCNLLDDDCDTQVDEKVRPQCGEGWCRRDAPTCDAASCIEGDPRVEECNLFDDDCDGIVDNDACGSGLSCIGGECVVDESPPIAKADQKGDSGGCATPGNRADTRSTTLMGTGLLLVALGWMLRRRRGRKAESRNVRR